MKKIFIAIIILIILTVCYFVFFRITKEKAVKIISGANSARSTTALDGMDEEYLISWANAIRWKRAVFSHQGKNYLTETGKSI